MATNNSHGLEPQEEAIMDLWDDGLSLAQIANALGIEETRVDFVVAHLADGKRSDRWACHARLAGHKLVARIARFHPEMLAG